MNKKRRKKIEFCKKVKKLNYNKGLSIEILAEQYGKSKRTIYRWLKSASEPLDFVTFCDKN